MKELSHYYFFFFNFSKNAGIANYNHNDKYGISKENWNKKIFLSFCLKLKKQIIKCYLAFFIMYFRGKAD